MQVQEIMTTNVMTVGPGVGLKAAARLMVDNGISGLPVVGDDGTLVGIITEADFIKQEAARSHRRYRRLLEALFGEHDHRPVGETVDEAMTRHPVTIDPGTRIAEAAREMADRGIKRLPVVDDVGRLVGIVSRADIMAAFVRPDSVIAAHIRSDVAERILMIDADTITIDVTEGVVSLSGSVPTRTDARLLEELTGRLEGVVRVESNVAFDMDDTRAPESTDRIV
jgi:CBS domain-containing protein